LPNIKAQATRCLSYFKNPVIPQTPATNSPSVSKRTRTIHAGSYTFQKNYSKTYIKKWAELEKRVVKYATGEAPYPFRPFVPCLSSDTQNRDSAVIACKGRFQLASGKPALTISDPKGHGIAARTNF